MKPTLSMVFDLIKNGFLISSSLKNETNFEHGFLISSSLKNETTVRIVLCLCGNLVKK
jgi:hypothetical protein